MSVPAQSMPTWREAGCQFCCERGVSGYGTHAVGPVCAWLVEEGMTQDTTGVGIELVDTGRLAVEADLLIEESVSALSVRDYVFGSTSIMVTY